MKSFPFRLLFVACFFFWKDVFPQKLTVELSCDTAGISDSVMVYYKISFEDSIIKQEKMKCFILEMDSGWLSCIEHGLSTSVNIINGKTNSSITYKYVAVTKKSGTLNVPRAKIVYYTNEFTSPEKQCHVKKIKTCNYRQTEEEKFNAIFKKQPYDSEDANKSTLYVEAVQRNIVTQPNKTTRISYLTNCMLTDLEAPMLPKNSCVNYISLPSKSMVSNTAKNKEERYYQVVYTFSICEKGKFVIPSPKTISGRKIKSAKKIKIKVA